jgi:hypothetical protein
MPVTTSIGGQIDHSKNQGGARDMYVLVKWVELSNNWIFID